MAGATAAELSSSLDPEEVAFELDALKQIQQRLQIRDTPAVAYTLSGQTFLVFHDIG